MKTHPIFKFGTILFSLLLLFSSCEKKMDEKAVIEYFAESPAVTLYAPCSFEEEQPDLKEYFIGKSKYYYNYKAFNYRVERIDEFYAEGNVVQGELVLMPDNLTPAGERFNEQRETTPYLGQMKDSFRCFFVFNKREGDWVLMHLKSLQYARGFWDVEDNETYVFMNLLDWDQLRNTKTKRLY